MSKEAGLAHEEIFLNHKLLQIKIYDFFLYFDCVSSLDSYIS
jgi:hypothetical protein